MKTTLLTLFALITAGVASAADQPVKTEYATFGAGCFWCVEAVFERTPGVLAVESGYCNGEKENPTYKEVCSGRTGHVEAVRITYDPSKVKYEKLVRLLFKSHDPTTLNRQGADRGTQYRSGIYFHSEDQRKVAERIKKEAQADFEDPIVTEIVKAEKWYPAEGYHQDYYKNNPSARYSQFITYKLMQLDKKLAKEPAEKK